MAKRQRHPRTKLGITSQTSYNQTLKYNSTTDQATREGGIVLLCQKNINANLIESDHTHTIEYAIWKSIL